MEFSTDPENFSLALVGVWSRPGTFAESRRANDGRPLPSKGSSGPRGIQEEETTLKDCLLETRHLSGCHRQRIANQAWQPGE